MRLTDLLKGVSTKEVKCDLDSDITGLSYDSRRVEKGHLFVAMRGSELDGHAFIEKALEKGAQAVIFDSGRLESGIPAVRVEDSREALGILSENFYERPFEGMNLIGITGTNGKTTTSYLLESIMFEAGKTPAVMGTVNYRLPGKTFDAPMTTPESLEIMKMLRRMKDSGVSDVVMEVSSHALAQGRVKRCPFRAALFTNLSRDHLDYHGTMENYFEAKGRLFRELQKEVSGQATWAVINGDDPRAGALAGITDASVFTYGFGSECDLRAEDIRLSKKGIIVNMLTADEKREIRSPLIGRFNVSNILAAAAVSLCLGISMDAIEKGVAGLKGVPGRLEPVENDRSLTILVDYAHTPDALKKALDAVAPLNEGRLISVVGCGGDRDSGKRMPMGMAAGEKSHLVFITSDNPRTEDPMTIASQVEEGVRASGKKRLSPPLDPDGKEAGYVLELDRKRAIELAVRSASQKDLILIAGKGHEDYQIIGRRKRHFDDREVAKAAASVRSDLECESATDRPGVA